MKLIEKIKKNKLKSIVLLIALLLIVLTLFFVLRNKSSWHTPTISITPPKKVSVLDKDTFSLDLCISDLGEVLYPAASFSIDFDSSRLELMAIEEGNVFVYGEKNSKELTQNLPDWSFNIESSNKLGKINIMYLDITGGKHAFSRELLDSDTNVILRLSFRLRGSAKAGDVYELSIEDAVFAASDSEESLAMTQDTLKAKNGRIVIGE